MGEHCTKCKKDGHRVKDCEQAIWEPWENQECDVCFQTTNPPHEALTCKSRIDGQPICHRGAKGCGHMGHNIQACPIKDTNNDEHVMQYTKSKYDAAMQSRTTASKGRQSQATTAGDPRFAPSSSRFPSTPGYGARPNRQPTTPMAIRNGRPATSNPASSSAATVPDASIQPESRAMTRSNLQPTPLTAEKEEALQWARERFDAVPFSRPNINRPSMVVANFVRMGFTKQNVVLHKYRIQLGTINGKDVTKAEVRRALIEKLLGVQRPPTVPFVSDYSSYVISVGPLYPAFTSSEPCGYSVPHLRTGRPNEGAVTLNTIFWFEGRFDKTNLLSFFNYESTKPAGMLNYHPNEDVRTLNTVTWKSINDSARFVGGRSSKKFYPDGWGSGKALSQAGKGPTYVVHGGFYSSVRPGHKSLLLNINPTKTAFFPAVNLQEWINTRWPDPKAGKDCLVPPNEVHELKDVRVTFEGDGLNNILEKRIICDFGTGDKYFFNENKVRVKVIEHIRAKYPTLPVDSKACWVNCGSKLSGKERWYPAKYMKICPWQVVHGLLSGDHGAQMITLAKRPPGICMAKIVDDAFPPLGVVKASNPPRGTSGPASETGAWPPFYEDFGLRTSGELLKIQARFLEQPVLSFHGKEMDLRRGDEGRRAGWNLTSYKFNTVPPQGFTLCFIVIVPHHGKPCKPDDLKDFKYDLVKSLRGFGFKINNHRQQDIDEEMRPVEFRANLDTAYTKLTEASGVRPRLVIVLIPKKEIKIYSLIKWWGDCVTGVPTICVMATALERNQYKRNQNGENIRIATNRNFLANLSLKVNFKLGYTIHRLKDDLQWDGTKPHTMIVGADVSHPGKVPSASCPSMAGVVATCGPGTSHYLASARLQSKNTEFIVGLDSMIKERVLDYREKQQRLPDHILFYRDGVSESQFGMVKLRELPLIKAGCKEAGRRAGHDPDWCPRITLLVVGKRHHSRFFKEYPGEGDLANPAAGLVVDTTVTSPSQADFYLQSHDSPLGTARSAHYIVIANESKYMMDEIQVMTNKICFTGSRATKSMSVCTPARYADILCDRLRCYMRGVLFSQGGPTHGGTLQEYQDDPATWGVNAANGRLNPWSPAVDNIMFYL